MGGVNRFRHPRARVKGGGERRQTRRLARNRPAQALLKSPTQKDGYASAIGGARTLDEAVKKTEVQPVSLCRSMHYPRRPWQQPLHTQNPRWQFEQHESHRLKGDFLPVFYCWAADLRGVRPREIIAAAAPAVSCRFGRGCAVGGLVFRSTATPTCRAGGQDVSGIAPPSCMRRAQRARIALNRSSMAALIFKTICRPWRTILPAV